MRRSASGSASVREAAPVWAKALVAPDDLHGLSVHRAQNRVVLEEDRARVLDDRGVRWLRERVARDLDVVVSEDGEDAEARLERRDRRLELRLPAPPGEEVARDRDDVARLLRRPANRALERATVEGDRAEVEVRQMDDREPVELGWEARKLDLLDPELDPLGLEERPAENARRGRARDGGTAPDHALSPLRADALAEPGTRGLDLAAKLLGALAAAVRLRPAAPAHATEHDRGGGGESRHSRNEEEEPARPSGRF